MIYLNNLQFKNIIINIYLNIIYLFQFIGQKFVILFNFQSSKSPNKLFATFFISIFIDHKSFILANFFMICFCDKIDL